jgi:hypothetical protein
VLEHVVKVSEEFYEVAIFVLVEEAYMISLTTPHATPNTSQ